MWSYVKVLILIQDVQKDFCVYTEISYLQLIWLSQKWQILKVNLYRWVIVPTVFLSFLVFPSLKYLNQTSFVYHAANLLLKLEFSSNWPLDSPFANNICTTLLYKLSIWPTDDQIMQMCEYLKGGSKTER